MGSDSRQRTKLVAVRLYEHEYDQLTTAAENAGVSTAELVRAVLFNRAPQPRTVSCSPFHEHCNPHHRNLVDGYRDQHYRELLALEGETGMHQGDIDHWKETGGRMTTFGDWIKSNAS